VWVKTQFVEYYNQSSSRKSLALSNPERLIFGTNPVTGHFKTSQSGSNQPATSRWFIHIRFLDARKWLFNYFSFASSL
jgi:hypothetical protein